VNRGLAVLALAGFALGAAAQSDKVIDVRAARPAAGNSFEALWTAYRKTEAAGDLENSRKAFEEIRRLRTERNVASLEPVGLALVSRGLDSLDKGDRERAESELRRAIAVDPHLADAYLALALAQVRKGPLGVLGAARDLVAGFATRLGTIWGRLNLMTLAVAVGLLGWALAVVVYAVVEVMRHGGLLQHDLEESLGPARGRPFAVGVFGLLLLLPLVTFQGFGWLPLWWLALLFAYASRAERVLTGLVLASTLAVGPLLALLEERVMAAGNPLFRASALAIEGSSDRRAMADLETASRKTPDDRDLQYMLGRQYKKAGQYDDAANLYRDMVRADEKDAIALNNLGNIEFARGEFAAAIVRYKQAKAASDSGVTPEVVATIYYNLSLAHLQKFDRQEADEARSQADRLGSGLTRYYDQTWKYESRNENAVVDLGLNSSQLWPKFAGRAEGVALKNLAGRPQPADDPSRFLSPALNRFTGFLGVFGLVVLALRQWRGKRAFTMRCLKCGTPFCKRCHLGAAPGGLCTQCFHLFVVRDGVSGPARNQKLLEVQHEDERREKVFRVLTLVSPGAGHLYANKTFAGIGLTLAWYTMLACVLLAGRVLPVSEAPSTLASRLGLMLGAMVLLTIYLLANRARPDFEADMPLGRAPRRTRTA